MKTWTPKNIEKLRRDMTITQADFGQRLGVTGNYIYLLEKGVKTPSNTVKLLLDCVEEKFKGTNIKTERKVKR
jgi:DNA-binding transcriptional regulator YiaG